jgi:hypothetical protein
MSKQPCLTSGFIFLVLDVSLDQIRRHMFSSRTHVVAIRPQFPTPVRPSQPRILGIQFPRRDAFDHPHHLGWGISRWATDKQMHMVSLHCQCFHLPIPRPTYLPYQLIQLLGHITLQHFAPVARDPDKVIRQSINRMCTSPCLHDGGYSTNRLRGPLCGPHVACRSQWRDNTPACGGPVFLPGASAGVSNRRLS